GWLDLLVVHDWGPIRVWKNTAGRLSDISEAAGTSGLIGCWNGIAGGDVDQDGDIDYLVTNLGLNTAQQASPEKPLLALYGNLTEFGTPVLLETVRNPISGAIIPKRSFEDWKAAIPGVGEKFADSRAFAAGFDTMFSPERQKDALRVSANTLETGLLINEGGTFRFLPLPAIVQAAPSYGVVMTDVNFDGRTDAYLVQNREHAGQAADPTDNGMSVLLLGTGNAAAPLRPAWPDESGLALYGQGRSVTVVDLDNDDRPDLIVGVSEAAPAAFLNIEGSAEHRPVKVNLKEPGEHPEGARVTLTCDGMAPQVAEYHAGGGFLSQSPPVMFFGAPRKAGSSAKLQIRWANGETTERTIYFD
ncbi:MAG: CRTAC1 family protein, partial [Verrucomicrobiae bacterium]|nr:CRTAC1 family protein [Verrucomicrobiae bacterium]